MQHVLHRIARRVARYLRDQPAAAVRRDGDLAGVVVDLAREDAKECRLARAACADDGRVLAARDVEGEILEDALSLTVREGNILRFKE